MKYSIALILLFTLSTTIYSQKKSVITISAGGSFPIGEFADESVTSESSGLANAGQVVGISWSRLVSKNYGISIGVYGQRNPIDVNRFENFLSTTPVQAPFSGNVHLFPNWQFKKVPWTLISALVGGYAEVPFQKPNKLMFVPKVMLGVGFAKSPEIEGSSETDTSFAIVEQTSQTGTGFSYLISGGFHYQLNKSTSLVLSLDYQGTSMIEFDNVRSRFMARVGEPGDLDYEAWENQITAEGSQVYKAINLHVGIAFRL